MRKSWLLVLTALFWFSFSFIVTYWVWAPALFPQIDVAQNEHLVVAATPASKEQWYIGVVGDYVAIFCGEPQAGGYLIEETDIPIAKVHRSKLHDLYQGIVFTSDDTKASILAGLYFPE